MLKLRALSFSLLLGATTLLTGCFEDVEAPRIKGLAVNPTVVPATGAQIQGIVEYDTDKASVSFQVSGATGDVSNKFDFSQSITLGSSPASLGTINPREDATVGNYTLTVKVVDDEGNTTSETAKFSFGVPTDDNLLNNMGDNSRILGAQGNSTEGSFLDVDGFKVFKSGTKTDSEKSTIDVVLFASPNTATGTLLLLSPKQAAADNLGAISSWGSENLNPTIIVKAGGPVLTRDAAIRAIGASTSEKAEVQSGATYALKLSNDAYASITIQSINGVGNAAAVTLQILAD
ncbi:MAG: hypothetical protein IPK50_09795 [Fibrobacterota bacterium]|nr:MAG: hypothetical protein IPK50_09795 [Fibrobacterota bacterium]